MRNRQQKRQVEASFEETNRNRKEDGRIQSKEGGESHRPTKPVGKVKL